MVERFQDRTAAGEALGEALRRYANRPDVLVLALPRGGVPVGVEVARRLHAPLDVLIVRKLGVPGHEEFAMGAVACGGVRVLNDDIIAELGIPEHVIEEVATAELKEVVRRGCLYRGNRPPPQLRNRTLILVDDGLATGATMRAATQAVRQQDPKRIVIAIPTAPPGTCRALSTDADEVVCLMCPKPFYAIAMYYDDFGQVSDAEVQALLQEASAALKSDRPRAISAHS